MSGVTCSATLNKSLMSSRRVSFSSSPPTRDAHETSSHSFEKLFASALDPQTHDHHQRHLALAKNVLFQNELGCDSEAAWAYDGCS